MGGSGQALGKKSYARVAGPAKVPAVRRGLGLREIDGWALCGGSYLHSASARKALPRMAVQLRVNPHEE